MRDAEQHHIILGNEAENGISPLQPLMQPLLPRIPALDTVMSIVVEENVMAVAPQPAPHFSSEFVVLA
ncbi:MAG: hypothetical protein ACRDSF_04395 [Pseudonocardiaceae bacterium]